MMRTAFSLLVLLAARPVLASAPKPNILLIVADDLGYSDLGCYGGKIELIDERFVMTEAEAEVPRWRELPPESQAIESRRMAACAGMDRIVGRVMDTLKAKGMAENTIVIDSADNGHSTGD